MPRRPSVPFAFLAACLCATLALGQEPAQQPPAEPPPASKPRRAARPVEIQPAPGHDLAALAARDRRLEFPPQVRRRARAVLESSPDSIEERAVALLALGACGSSDDLARIESKAAE